MAKETKITTIQVTPETKKRLMEHGKMGWSFDEVINHVLDKIEGRKEVK